MPRQLKLIAAPSLAHGGATQGKRKTRRPLDAKRPVHVILKSSRARGAQSLLAKGNAGVVLRLQQNAARKFHVQILRHANVGNHLHLIVKAKTRKGFQSFLRYLTGQIAMKIGGGKKSRPQGRFWDDLAWTRVLGWGRDLRQALAYLLKNLVQDRGYTGSLAKLGASSMELDLRFNDH